MKKVFLLAAAAMALVACSNDGNDVDEPVAVQITATIGKSALTRASDTSWESGDRIGITMGDRYTNMAYTYTTKDGNEIFTGTTMYFKNKTEPVTLTAYYPYMGIEDQTPAVVEASTSVERQTPEEQPKFDFLYAIKKNVTGAQPNVNLAFSHQMSKITLIFKNGNEGTEVSKITSYTIDGLILEGTFNPSTGMCAAKADVAAAPLSVTLPEGTVKHEEALPSLIVFPQATAGKTVTLKIKDNQDQDYACTLNFGDDGIVEGNNYLYTIKVSKTGLSVNSSITEWNPIDNLNSEAKSED